MRALTLDYRRSPRGSWAGVALLVAGVAGAALVGSQYRQLVDEEARAESGAYRAAAAERKKAVRPGAASDPRVLALEVARARKLLVQLSMPWDDVFEGIEAVDSRNVGLLRIESDLEKQSIKIDAEARNISAMLRYLRAMEALSTFVDVHLQSHQVQMQDAQHPVRFVVAATWKASR